LLFPQEYVETRIERLKQGFTMAHGWILLVDDFGAKEICSPKSCFAYRLTKLSVPTIYLWMRLLGFKYEPQKKCYYVDGHEKPETKAYRKNFLNGKSNMKG
jgi:hypothetical protein